MIIEQLYLIFNKQLLNNKFVPGTVQSIVSTLYGDLWIRSLANVPVFPKVYSRYTLKERTPSVNASSVF